MFDANFIANPYPTHQHLLATGRLHWIECAAGGVWFMPHYDYVMSILNDPRVSNADYATLIRQYPPEERENLRILNRSCDRGWSF